MAKKIVIIGGVAGGASAAARLRRLDETAEIVLFEKGEQISFANCGMPYYIGSVIPNRSSLLLQTPASLYARFRIDVRTRSEVTAIHPDKHCVTVLDESSGNTYEERYDSLILSPGAYPVRPPFPGADLDRVFTLRNMNDCDAVKSFVAQRAPKRAVVVGGGFIGLEMMENLVHLGLQVTLVEMASQVMAPLDRDMARFLHPVIRAHGVDLRLGVSMYQIQKSDNGALSCQLSSGDCLEADLVILAIGVRPDSRLAADAGLTLGLNGSILTDEYMQTSAPDVYAIGDAVTIRDFVSGTPAVTPLAGPANRQGRMVAGTIAGRDFPYPGTLGTSICQVFELAAASTGNNEKQLKRQGRVYDKVYLHPAAHASYYPNAKPLHLKVIFDPQTGRVLGAQAVGEEGVDKRIDVIATAIAAGMTVEQLENLELAYAPPFSSAKDPVNLAGFIASNTRRGDLKQIFVETLPSLDPEQDFLLDVRTPAEYAQGSIGQAVNIPVDALRERMNELPKNKRICVFCRVGLRGYVACRILAQYGFDTANLSGGYLSWLGSED